MFEHAMQSPGTLTVQQAISDLAGLGKYLALLADTQPAEFLCQVKEEIQQLRLALSSARAACGEAAEWIDEQLCWVAQDGVHPESCKECKQKKVLVAKLRAIAAGEATWERGSIGFRSYMQIHHASLLLDSYTFKEELLKKALVAWDEGGPDAAERAIKEESDK